MLAQVAKVKVAAAMPDDWQRSSLVQAPRPRPLPSAQAPCGASSAHYTHRWIRSVLAPTTVALANAPCPCMLIGSYYPAFSPSVVLQRFGTPGKWCDRGAQHPIERTKATVFRGPPRHQLAVHLLAVHLLALGRVLALG